MSTRNYNQYIIGCNLFLFLSDWLRLPNLYDMSPPMRAKTDPVQTLIQFLKNGRFAHQSRIPPERVLAAELGMTRTALRKALSVLEARNRIWRHVGRGTFVGPKPTSPNGSMLSAVTSTTNPGEIMETRLVLELKMAAIAALRSTQNDLERMEHCLNRTESTNDFDTFEHWDGALHVAIAESTHNLLLISIFKTVNNLRQDKLWGRLKKAAMTGTRQKSYIRQHRELIRAIRNRDPANAEKAMRIHLETVQKNLMGNI
jgi:DNA-binding FadR family transcriptional regulator